MATIPMTEAQLREQLFANRNAQLKGQSDCMHNTQSMWFTQAIAEYYQQVARMGILGDRYTAYTEAVEAIDKCFVAMREGVHQEFMNWYAGHGTDATDPK